jgi:hypothetical protein
VFLLSLVPLVFLLLADFALIPPCYCRPRLLSPPSSFPTSSLFLSFFLLLLLLLIYFFCFAFFILFFLFCLQLEGQSCYVFPPTRHPSSVAGQLRLQRWSLIPRVHITLHPSACVAHIATSAALFFFFWPRVRSTTFSEFLL